MVGNKVVATWMELLQMVSWVWDLGKFQFLVFLQKQDWFIILSQCALMRKVLEEFTSATREKLANNLLHFFPWMESSMDILFWFFTSSTFYANILICLMMGFLSLTYVWFSNTYIIGVEAGCVESSCLQNTRFRTLVDSGTSFTFLPEEVYQKVVQEVLTFATMT